MLIMDHNDYIPPWTGKGSSKGFLVPTASGELAAEVWKTDQGGRHPLGRARPNTLRDHPERDPNLALIALERGYPLGRRLTKNERLALAVASARPTHHMTLTTSDMTQPELADAFDLLKLRIERSRKSRNFRLVYFGVYAQGKGDGGCHLHLLLWQWPYIPLWLGHARDLGIGRLKVKRISPSTPDNVLRTVGYVLGQNESVFGTRKQYENEPREKHKHGFAKNHATTLEKHNPELLRAIELAKDKSLSGETLYAQLPRFIRTYTTSSPTGFETECANTNSRQTTPERSGE
jgi:hypothetical protein